MANALSCSQARRLADQVMAYCDDLAKYTQVEGMIDRRYLTPEHKQTNQQLARWANSSALQSWQDSAGNQWIRLPSVNPAAKRIIMGSHTDTVPNGGRYDGMLGVVAPLVLLKFFAEQQIQFDFHLDVVGFGDEEGTRFGSTLLGSSAVTGDWKSSWQDLCDSDGVSLSRAMDDFGLDMDDVEQAAINFDEVLLYFETHIEQGPVLEQVDRPLAAVKGIAGARRFEISVIGDAGHAGTVPMNLRRDPLVVVSEWITQVNNRVMEYTQAPCPVVATVGRLQVLPGAVNVIPGRVNLSLDVRSLSDSNRDELIDALNANLASTAARQGLRLEWTQTHNASAVACDEHVTQTLSDTIAQCTDGGEALVSGAGHDAMLFANKVPTTMLFVRCKGGVSHHPAESILAEDVAAGLKVMAAFLSQYQ
ncbi:allantoate amidohydrolase [Vibrio sinaloensis]|uniref:allantoate amidohydrolase n=1 Tax=Photobacterium sp. (strain ATCC 43367) TaxID=379097 RepID=UPI00206DDC1A|nr:allantoate amidohydrolase [Vibrio sinaloensis]UPQ89333.1 allantoate amidohydrolase [Vibrio sinaloensis]